MAMVYLARDQELDREVAVKVLAEHLATDAEFRERFLREARVAGRLSHPNIVKVYDGGEVDGRPFIVMEYVEGVTLADELARRKRFPAAEVVELAVQACAGLEHAHGSGLVHRDVKPQNLLLEPDGRLKIADFGIARAVEGSTQLTAVGTVLGTAVYLAPEQAAGEQVTAAADIYSLGAVLYELIAGRPPFAFQSIPELILKQRAGRITSLQELAPDVPARLDEAILRCLAAEPAARPSSAAALAQELRAETASEHPTAVSPALAVTRARSRRRLWPAIAGGIALAAAIGGLALAARDDGTPNDNAPAVEPVPAGAEPAERARNLAEWIRERSG
jgi:eukaryotic-like serine/threonine-protein kinase